MEFVADNIRFLLPDNEDEARPKMYPDEKRVNFPRIQMEVSVEVAKVIYSKVFADMLLGKIRTMRELTGKVDYSSVSHLAGAGMSLEEVIKEADQWIDSRYYQMGIMKYGLCEDQKEGVTDDKTDNEGICEFPY